MRQSRLALGVLLLAALLLAGGPAIAPAAAPQDTIVLGTTDKITELSPENSYDYWTWHVFGQISEALVQFKPGTTDIVGQLAESWQIAPDGLSYTFRLRPGVTFTDGRPFDAASVKQSLETVLRRKGPEGGVALIENIKTVEVVDTRTVRIRVKERDATFLSRMTWGVAPAHIYRFTGPANEYAKGRFVGTGPYRLAQYVPDQRTVYEAYPGYWGPQPRSKRVITVFYADASALAAAVEAGQVDVGFRTFNPEDIRRLQQSPRVSVLRGPSLSVRYIVFNVTAKPFDDVRVRRAVAFALDRDRIARNVFGGINTPLYSMVPPGLWSHIEAFPKRNLDQARSLLREAGYSEGKKLTLILWLTPVRYGNTEPDAGAVVKRAIEETGLASVEIKTQEWATYTKSMAAGQFGMFFLGWFPDFVDPDNFLSPWLIESPEGLGTFLNKATSARDKQYYDQFKQMLTQAKMTADRAERTRLYQQAQRLLAESAILVPMWSNNLQAYAIYQKNVKGIILNPDMSFRTWTVFKE
ncbi:MAG: ABC transporter substrate-binding protein [Armatimonadota bacterium]|nr:ABC transporter substrate-binding protein [Armatimonadota bacterium]MDR7465168.1 ABC transporter substrate-binding protein [Armatimonadota bacterium]MDR7470651.1 ABC transporter substrate-binding protein [Armatimonadota bacterium]MDR7474313.1 ABC transporter substrate-binding protein [Armatimonadota bacterium]MDR7539923.1 ABC transporter substrate-binding protein [Armatimonadota bacterium]